MLKQVGPVTVDPGFIGWIKGKEKDAVALGVLCLFHPELTPDRSLSVMAAVQIPGRFTVDHVEQIMSEVSGFVVGDD